MAVGLRLLPLPFWGALLAWKGRLARKTRGFGSQGRALLSAGRLQNIFARSCRVDMPENGVGIDRGSGQRTGKPRSDFGLADFLLTEEGGLHR